MAKEPKKKVAKEPIKKVAKEPIKKVVLSPDFRYYVVDGTGVGTLNGEFRVTIIEYRPGPAGGGMHESVATVGLIFNREGVKILRDIFDRWLKTGELEEE